MRRTRLSSPSHDLPAEQVRDEDAGDEQQQQRQDDAEPGMYRPKSASGRHGGGISTSDWSRMPDRNRTTQTVIMIGSQISSPAIR